MSRRSIVVLSIALAAAGGVMWYCSVKHSATENDAEPANEVTSAELLREGLAAIRRGNVREAADIRKRLAIRPAASQHASILQAAMLLNRGDVSESLRVIRTVRAEGELSLPAGLVMTQILYRLHDLASAEKLARAIAKDHPKNADAHRWLAAIYFDLGANRAAKKHLESVAEIDRKDFAPHHLMGQMEFDAENYIAAIQHFRTALTLNPPPRRKPAIVESLARTLVKTGQYEKTLEVTSNFPSRAAMMAMAGEAHWGLSRPNKARQLLQQAQKLEPDNRAVLVLKARMAMESGDIDGAMTALRRQLTLDPEDFECRYRLALCYQKLRKTDRYEQEIARMRRAQKLREQLSRLTEQAIQQPRDAGIRDQIADLYVEIGKPKLAEVFRRAAEACRRLQQVE